MVIKAVAFDFGQHPRVEPIAKTEGVQLRRLQLTARRVIMATEVIPLPKSEITESIIDSEQTTCCVVGGGPGGMMLALLLARKGVPVTLLEAHKDFDRDFRGDTIHPSVLEILDEIGLAEPLHKLRHVKVFGPTLRAANTSFNPIDFRRPKTKFPYIIN